MYVTCVMRLSFFERESMSCNVSGNDLYTFKLSHLFTERWPSPENNDPDGWLANFVTWSHAPYLVDPGFQNVLRTNETQKNSPNEVLSCTAPARFST